MPEESQRNQSSDSQLGWMMGAFALGTFVGAATALLLATQSGAETRADLAHGLEEVKKKLSELNDQVKTRSKEIAEKGRSALEEKKQVVKSAIEAGREAAKKTREEHVAELPAGDEATAA